MTIFSNVTQLIDAVMNEGPAGEYVNDPSMSRQRYYSAADVELEWPDNIKHDAARRNEEVQKLAAFLKTNPPMSSLILNNQELTAEEGKILAAALEVNNTLHRLELVHNNLGAAGAQALGRMLKINTSLCSFHIRHNTIGVDGEKALIEGLTGNASLIDFTIDYNRKHDREITQLLHRNQEEIPAAINDYASSIFGARLLQAIQADETITKKTPYLTPHSPEKHAINHSMREQLLAGLSSTEIIAFSNHWHEPAQQDRRREMVTIPGTWAPLFGDKITAVPKHVLGEEGWTVVARLSADELALEASQLNNCVGRIHYARDCVLANSHILSVIDPRGKPVSTIEFRTDYATNSCTIKQHEGESYSLPSHKATEIAAWCKTLPIDYSTLQQERSNRIALASCKSPEERATHHANLMLGFNPFDRETCKAVDGTYYRMLPDIPKLKENFRKIRAIQVIDLGTQMIAGKSLFILPPPPEKIYSKGTTIKHDDILPQIQENLDILLGKGIVSAAICRDNWNTNTQRNFGNVVITPLSNNPIPKRLTEEFVNVFVPEGAGIRINLTPKPVLFKLAGLVRRTLSHREIIDNTRIGTQSPTIG